MTKYLLDTNTVSQITKWHPVVDRRVVRVPLSSIAVSSITAGELMYGLARRPDAQRLQLVVRELLRRIDVLPWDRTTADANGDFRAGLERSGKTLGPFDMLIAAHALAVGAVLVTSDQALSQIAGLQIEDWTAERS